MSKPMPIDRDECTGAFSRASYLLRQLHLLGAGKTSIHMIGPGFVATAEHRSMTTYLAGHRCLAKVVSNVRVHVEDALVDIVNQATAQGWSQ